MRLTLNEIDMLFRCALSEFFTSPTIAARYDRRAVYLALYKRGMVDRFSDGRCLTDVGRSALEASMTTAQREQLADLQRTREIIRQRAGSR